MNEKIKALYWDIECPRPLKETMMTLVGKRTVIHDIKPLTKKQTHTSLGEIEEIVTSAVIYIS